MCVCVSDVKLCKFFVIVAVSKSFSDLYTELLETAVQHLSVAAFVVGLFECVRMLNYTTSMDVLTALV